MTPSTILKGLALTALSLGPIALATPLPFVNKTLLNTALSKATCGKNATTAPETGNLTTMSDCFGCPECRQCHDSCQSGMDSFMRPICIAGCQLECMLMTGNKDRPPDPVNKRYLEEEKETPWKQPSVGSPVVSASYPGGNTTTLTTNATVSVEPANLGTTNLCKDFPIECRNLILPFVVDGCEAVHRLACMKDIPHPIPGLRKKPPRPPPQPGPPTKQRHQLPPRVTVRGDGAEESCPKQDEVPQAVASVRPADFHTEKWAKSIHDKDGEGIARLVAAADDIADAISTARAHGQDAFATLTLEQREHLNELLRYVTVWTGGASDDGYADYAEGRGGIQY